MRKVVIAGVAVLVLGVAAAAWAQPRNAWDGDGRRAERGKATEQVLADLVADGTITQAQSDAILAAFEAKRAEVAAAREELRAQLDSFWSDDVLTADEIAQLPFADRFTGTNGPLADALQDGQLTKEEVDEIRSQVKADHERRDIDRRHDRHERKGWRLSARLGGTAA